MDQHNQEGSKPSGRIMPTQVMRIWALFNALGIKEDAVRADIHKYTGREFLHDLTREEADGYISSLDARAKGEPVNPPPKQATVPPVVSPAVSPKKAKDDMATQAQIDFIDSLLGRLKTEGGWNNERLTAWWIKYVKIDSMDDLTKRKARGVIGALLKMVDKYRKEYHKEEISNEFPDDSTGKQAPGSIPEED